MLKYLVTITQDLLFLGIVTGLLYACAGRFDGRRGRVILTVGALVGLAAAGVMSWFKNNTKLVNTGLWNMDTLIVSAAAFILFCAFTALRHVGGGKGGFARAMNMCASIAAALVLATYIFYAMPDVYAHPASFAGVEGSVFSTDFLYKMIGFLLGFLVVILTGLAAHRTARDSRPALATGLTALALLLLELRFLAGSLGFIRQTYLRKLIPFSMIQLASKYAANVLFGAAAVALILAAAMIVRSVTYKEPYNNSAEKRKIVAKWRSRRRWAIALIVFTLIAMVIVTAVKAYVNRPIELSPTEEAEVTDGYVYYPLENAADGHLHRFGYTTKNGVEVRVILIQKPGTQVYGIGLDACEICGKTGYYEKSGGQVVCNKCDVIMNINAIGLVKDGCYPIPVAYEIQDGMLVISTEELESHEKRFK